MPWTLAKRDYALGGQEWYVLGDDVESRMRLRFPNGEHAEVGFAKGEITIGSGPDERISLPHSGLPAHHSSLWLDRRGLWLRLAQGSSAHVNARPVRRLAWLRVGDQVMLDQLKFEVHAESLPALETQIPSVSDPQLDEIARITAHKIVVRQLSGANHGRGLSLTQPRILGSAAPADLVLTERDAPGRWAQVELAGDRIVLRNFAGKAVTVNGEQVVHAVLAPGDQLGVGDTRFLIEAPGMLPRGADSGQRPAAVSHTQTIRAIRTTTAPEAADSRDGLTPPAKDPGAFWWLLAAGAVVAVLITALLVFAPGP